MSAGFPRIRYADADGVFIAYEVRGDGPIDVVRVPGMNGSLMSSVVDPTFDTFWDRLASFSRFINFDRRGLGLSDPLLVGGAPPVEQQVSDIAAVMDAVQSERAALYASADGGPVAIMFAAMHPDRVSALVLNTSWARMFRSHDYPTGLDPADRDRFAQHLREHWGDIDRPWGEAWLAPSRRDDPGFRAVLAGVQQVSASKSAAVAALANYDNDVRDALPLVQAATLVLCGSDNVDFAEHSEYLAEHIPNAALVHTTGADMIASKHDREDSDLIAEFITGTRPLPRTDRILATVLFTDIVGSTQRAEALGDQGWRDLLDRHDALIRGQIAAFNGREVNTTGDGFLVTFDGPARAIRCAQAMVSETCRLGIELRVGVHVGECVLRGEDLAGLAVHIGARVAALAGPSQILTTRTVTDLVAGSGIQFSDLGMTSLKGIEEPWHIYRVSESPLPRP